MQFWKRNKGKTCGGGIGVGTASASAYFTFAGLSGSEIVALLAAIGSMATGIGVLVAAGGAITLVGVGVGSLFDKD